jgi:hypothetical protein
MADVIQGFAAMLGSDDWTGLTVGYEPQLTGDVHTFAPGNATLLQHVGGWANGAGTLRGISDHSGATYDPNATIYGDLLQTVPLGFVFNTGYGADPAEGDNAFLCDAVNAGIRWTAQNGELAEWELPLMHMPVLGKCFEYGTKTVSGNSVGIQFPNAIADGQTAYALLQVPVATSGTIDVIIESDDNSGFTSAVTRMTFAQVTTSPTYEFLTYTPDGGQTDDYWRVAWTSATTPSHKIMVTFGIF